MKLKRCTMAAVLAAIIIACIPALGQIDLLKGQDGRSEAIFGAYFTNETGNQSTVREYDGRVFGLWGLELLDIYGYNGDSQYWLNMRALIIKNDDILYNQAVRNEFSLSLSTSALTHRLDRTPEIDPYLAPFGMSAIAAPPITTGNSFVDMTPDNDLRIDRRVNELGVRLTPGSNNVAIVLKLWQESEHGLSQLIYRNGSSSRLRSVDFRIDRSTEQASLGTDLKIGSDTVVNYYVQSNQFSDSGSPLISGGPPNNLMIPDVKTSSVIIKARSRLSQRLYFTGALVNRKRSNQTEILSEGRSIDVNSSTASLSYTASDTLSLSGSYRNYALDNNVNPVLNEDSEVSNVGLNHSEQSLKFDANYTGIRKALVGIGCERRTTERALNDNFAADPDLDEVLAPKTVANISYLRFNYNPTWNLSLTGKMENWKVDGPAFTTSPDARTRMILGSTYTPSANLAVYADYNQQRDGRPDAEGLEHNASNTTVGVWYGLNSKLSLDTFYATGNVDSLTLWQIDDNDDGLLLDDVPYKARNKQWSVGLDYALTRKTNLYGRYLNSDSDGEATVLLIPGDPALPNGWAPVNVVENVWTLGFAYDLSAKDRLLVDFSTADWNDKIDVDNNGQYNTWRLAWSTTY